MKKTALNGIRFKMLMILLAFFAIILLMLILFQVVFYRSYYESMKKNEVKKISSDLFSHFGEEGFDQLFYDVAMRNDFDICIFTVTTNAEQSVREIRKYKNYFIMRREADIFPIILDNFRKMLSEDLYELTDLDESGNSASYTVFYRFIYDGTEYISFVKALIEPVETTTRVLQSQLLIISIISLVLVGGLSFLVSRSFSRPMEKLTKAAYALGQGDFNVTFEGGGYTEIDSLSQTLNYATGELKKTDDLRKDLIANVSHELRTPLTMIQAYAELIKDISGQNKEKREQHLAVILDETERLKKLVNDILDLSKLQSDVVEEEYNEFDISALIKRITSHFAGVLAGKGYDISCEVLDEALVYANEKQIEQVVYNLLSNAINYSGERKSVKVFLSDAGERFKIEITDSGKGIPPEELDIIWDKYFRSAETSRAAIGTGIGLSIVKTILLKHKFEFGVTSELDKGSDFYFYIPKEIPKLNSASD